MKHILLIAIAFQTVLLSGCTKEDFDLFTNPAKDATPDVEMVSAVMVDEESALLTGRVSDGGKAPVEVNGFFFSATDSNPSFQHLQLLQGGRVGEFQDIITGLIPDSTYYVRAFSTNEFGYTLSKEVVKIKVPTPEPVTAPCTIPEGTVYDNLFTFRTDFYSDVYAGSDSYVITISCTLSGGPEYRFYFNKAPLRGIYKTSTFPNLSLDKKNVYIEVKTSFNNWKVIEGADVFVNRESDGSIRMEFCNLYYQITTFSASLRGHVKIKP